VVMWLDLVGSEGELDNEGFVRFFLYFPIGVHTLGMIA